MKCSCLLVVVALVLHAAAIWPLTAAEPQAPLPPGTEKVRQWMQDRDYPSAIRALDEAIQAKTGPLDYLAYLKGWALCLGKQYGPAVAALEQVDKQYPKSPWARRARFAKAVAMARKGDFQNAELVYRSEAGVLLSADRKQELAGIYLSYADGYFRPPKPDEKPNHQLALEFYEKALEMGPRPEKRAEAALRVAECLQRMERTDQAVSQYTRFSEEYPRSPLDVEARYRLGECRLARHDPREARRVWEDLLAAYPNASSDRIAEAQFNLAKTWSVPEPATAEALSLGVAALEGFLERFPGHKLAGEAFLAMANSYSHRQRNDDAARVLSRFLKAERYQQCKEVPEARWLLGKAYQVEKKYPEALAAWREYLARHSSHERWSAVQQEVVNTEYLMGLEKCEAKQYGEAVRLWSEFLARHPLDRRDAEILLQFGRMNHAQEKWDAAIADWQRVVSKYPATESAAEAQWRIADTLEHALGRYEKAIEAYRKVAVGHRALDAAQAVARLEGKSFSIAAERVFRSGETPKVKLGARNIESVTVRVYQVDLETYFRKIHQAENVAPLNIALIDPDRTFEFKVPGYAKYRPIESEIEVPLPGGLRSGVIAVTVSSKTLEATTLVLQSDLDVIVKSSRDEVFVFAENMRTGKPWPGVRLLLSDGRQVFGEVVTGADGVLQQSFKELKEAGSVRVFGAAEGHVASTVVGLQGVKVARGLADRGYLYTDRPVYRAGQGVRVRGCIRQVSDDAYTLAKDTPYTLRVLDNRGREVWKEAVKLGPFGSFHAEFGLPPACPPGTYRIQAQDEDGRSYGGAFRVHEYKLEPVRILVDAPRRVCYRGEEIQGTIRVAYSYGAPLVGREVRYQLEGDREHTARTDEKGEVHFKLPTREFHETKVLPLFVRLPEEDLSTTANFMLAQQGFSIELSTMRPVFLAGETFEATAKVRDAEGKPLSQKLALKVLEVTAVEDTVGERPVAEHELLTAADGTGRKTLKLEKGGTYLLRAEGIDRFKNPVSGEILVEVSDEEDPARLRILADQHTYRVGDAAQVRVHWREQPALALVTFQGARVLGHQLVDLKQGDNLLSVPMTASLAPNFELSVAVMTDPHPSSVSPVSKAAGPSVSPLPLGEGTRRRRSVVRFHHVSSPFTVERDLKVSVSVTRKDGAKGPIRPGEEAAVTVVTTDPQGRPVSAEVSLAMVQQSLLERFAWPMPKIQDFFRGVPREPQVRTESSITFASRPMTTAINPRLLTEQERQELARAQEASRRAAVQPDAVRSQAGGMGGMGFGGEFPGAARPDGCRAATWGKPSGAGPAAKTAALADDADPFAAPTDEKAATSEGSAPDLPAAMPASPQSAKGKARSGQVQGQSRPDKLAVRQVDSRPLPDLSVEETGYWNPSVVTGKDGQATVTLTMPGQSTAWTLAAKGITPETLSGETSESLVVKKDLFGQLRLPTSFTDGDQAEIGVTVHNDLVDRGPIEVTLKTTVAGRTVEERKTIEVKSKGIQELAFKTTLAGAAAGQRGDAVFELVVAAAGTGKTPSPSARDVVRQTVPILPYGMPVFTAVSGLATSDTSLWIEPPKQMPIASPGLRIVIGPTVERSLLEIVSAPVSGPLQCPAEMVGAGTEVERATSDLMASLGLQKLVAGTREAGGPQALALDALVRSNLATLVSSQTDDGAWSWTGRKGAGHRYTTARALWAISLARSAGYRVSDDLFNKAVTYLRNQVAAAETGDFESRAILLHALAVAGHGDFALANHLYRERPSLSSAALAYLALALAEMDRKATAGELLDLLTKRKLDAPASADPSAGRELPWSHSPVEVRAIWALAVERVAPGSPKAKELADWLMAHRTDSRWTPDKATGPAALALGAWFAQSRFEGERYRLTVSVNDVQVKTLDVDPAAGSLILDVPAAQLKPEKQRVHFQITGRGRYAYQCVLGGFVPAQKLKSTTADWSVERTFEPAPLEFDGREVPRGFGCVAGPHMKFRNPLTQLPVGKRGCVQLDLSRSEASERAAPERLEYLVITEPIPSGASVIESSVRGGFDHFEIGPGAMTFYVGGRKSIAPIRYEVCGYLPGVYRAAPTVIRSAYRPDQLAVSAPKPLVVLPRGATGSDPYQLTPDELYNLGARLLEKGRKQEAAQRLSELVTKWNLLAEVYRKAIQSLLDIHLDLGPAGKVVHYFEIVKEKWPDQEISFDKIVRVGAAYHEIGEFERAYLIFRATVESRFQRESGVAGFLDEKGQFLRSVEVMERLLREYPPEPYLAAAQVGLSQRVYAKASEAAGDPQLVAQKINRIDLIGRAWGMLETALTEFPDDPAADQAAFSAANALLEMKDYARAAAACDRYARRYPKSELLDSFWYIVGYSRFASGQPKEAIPMCRKVAETQVADPATGRPKESPNKWRAIFILGQIYHSLGQAADAVREYRRVEDRFDDARRSIDYFLRKAIELPEATTFKPGQPVEVELKFRNLAACDVKVYRVDLMKFSLLERSLGGIARINLAGIRPQFETSVQLGDGKDYRDRTRRLPLPLKKEGAYLVVCRGENLHASGLVLITSLGVEVQADSRAGQVCATVKDVVADRYVSGAEVKVIGSFNEDFVSGTSDLRGVFAAEGIRGIPTVIVELPPGRYAFYRVHGLPRGIEATGFGAALPPRTAQAPRPAPARQQTAAAGEMPVSVNLFGVSEKEEQIRAALKGRTALDFTEDSFSNIIDYLKEYHKIEIQLDRKALEEVGFATDKQITVHLKDISLRSALRLLLRAEGLTYMVQDEVLLITTPDEAANKLITEVYPVADLVLPAGASGAEEADFDSLIELITSCVQPTTWDEVGGPGSIAPFENNMSLVLSQTEEVHEEITDLLQTLRAIKAGKGGALPVRRPSAERRPKRQESMGMGGGMGGMGGMGAGMGGMFGGQAPGAESLRGRDPSASGTTAGKQDADLLGGLQQSNQGLQRKHVDRLKGMSKGGMGGVGAGAAF